MSDFCEKHKWDGGPKDAPCPYCYKEIPYKNNPLIAFLKEAGEFAKKIEIEELLSRPDLEALEEKLLAGQERDARIAEMMPPRTDPETVRQQDEERERKRKARWN